MPAIKKEEKKLRNHLKLLLTINSAQKLNLVFLIDKKIN